MIYNNAIFILLDIHIMSHSTVNYFIHVHVDAAEAIQVNTLTSTDWLYLVMMCELECMRIIVRHDNTQI